MIYTCQNLVLVFHTSPLISAYLRLSPLSPLLSAPLRSSPLISAYLRLSPLISAISAYLRLSRIWGIFWGNLLIY